ncbi:MAG TPA: SRPBCC family protein [Anaeromyxobacter sp.]|nr:SRPBCC family protein [Anaeromyxobacter sp.]
MTRPETSPSAIDPSTSAERTLSTARLVPAPPLEVYAAFVAPARLARWWGPKGFRNTFEVCDPRPGGTWRYVMHGPNGGNYPNQSVFDALVPGERVVIRHVSGPRFTLTVTLAAEGAGTRVTWRQSFESAAEFESVRGYAGPANDENLDRLEAEVARGSM